MNRSLILGLIIFSTLFQSCGNSNAQKNKASVSASENGFAVVELFTSEGCSSCPPADDLANSIQENAVKNSQNIFILCEHVDYWNRLGWKDPFSKKFFSERQKWYSGFLNDEGIYTPQMVVNGTASFVGSDKDKATEAITKALSTDASNASFALLATDFPNGKFTYSISQLTEGEVLHIVLVEKNITSSVSAGENKGKTLHHSNIVRDWITVEHPLSSDSIQFKPDNIQLNKDTFEVIAFIQNSSNGSITMATLLK